MKRYSRLKLHGASWSFARRSTAADETAAMKVTMARVTRILKFVDYMANLDLVKGIFLLIYSEIFAT